MEGFFGAASNLFRDIKKAVGYDDEVVSENADGAAKPNTTEQIQEQSEEPTENEENLNGQSRTSQENETTANIASEESVQPDRETDVPDTVSDEKEVSTLNALETEVADQTTADELNEKVETQEKELEKFPEETAKLVAENVVEKAAEDAEEAEEVENFDVESDEGEFNGEFMNRLLVACVDSKTRAVNATLFLNALSEVPKLMSGLSSILKAGNGALSDKIKIVRTHLADTAKELKVDVKDVSLQQIVERDIKYKWTHTGKKARKATRNINRLVWFLDFISALFSQLADNHNAKGKNVKSLKDITLFCWNTTLGPRNKYLVNMSTKKMIQVAIFPKVEDFEKFLRVETGDKKAQVAVLRQWAGAANNVAEIMWEYIRGKNLENVP